MALELAMGCPPRSPASDSKDESAYCHAECCKDARERYHLFAEGFEFAQPASCLHGGAVWWSHEFCWSATGELLYSWEGFEPRLPFKLNVGEVAFKLPHSGSNILLNFGGVLISSCNNYTLSLDVFNPSWTPSGGSIGGSGRSKSLSSPGPSGSNMGFSKVASSIAALTVDANLKVVA